MILGSDFRPESGYRTDILLLVALDRNSGRISLISFPRDLWVQIPGYGEQRINTVMQLGGFQLLADTMQANFGIYPTQYAMIDMEGFLQVIDVLGGITIETDSYTADACETSLDPDRWCEVGPGTIELDSQWALWYVRARYNSSDFDRMRRTQEVVQAVIDKIASPAGMLNIPALTRIYDTEVESNISTDQILPLTQLALDFDSSQDIRRFTIGPDMVTPWYTQSGAAVLIPHTAAIQALLQEAVIFE
jgi:LCP family protein required for cell wall assembly